MIFRDLKICTKLTLIVLSAVIGLLSVTAFSLYEFKNHLYQGRQAKVQHQVDVVHQMLNHYRNLAVNGTVTTTIARQMAIDEIKALRYGEQNYFWLTNLTNKLVMHPFRQDLEGRDLSHFEDVRGKTPFSEMRTIATKQGSGFVSYWWEKPGTDINQQKISYVKLFIPWSWIIGSGVYVDDLEAIFQRHALIVGSALATILLCIVAFYRIIANSISKPLAEVTGNMLALSSGNLNVTVPQHFTHNEIGELQRATAHFQKKLLARQRDEQTLAKLSAAVEQNPTSIVITNSEGVIEYVNPKFEEISGFSASEVIGKTPRILNSGTTSRRQYKQLWKTLLAGRTWRGEFHNRHKNGSLYWEQAAISPIYSNQGHITHYLAIKEDINDRKEAEHKLFHQANNDRLTGLPNRELAKDRLSQARKRAQRTNRSVGLMFIDLDNFKIINDTLGHAAGDTLLIEMANRFKSCVREGDTVARLGGDEFLIILPDLKNTLAAESISLKIIESTAQPFVVNDREFFTTTSVGIAVFPDNADNSEDLLKSADAAMYKAKEAGGNTFRFFVEDMNTEALRRLETESQLRHALEHHEFSLVYQPIIDIDTGAIVKAEALIRWQNPSLGQISPDSFIPIAEDTGLINPIGEWVLREACQQMAAWNRALGKQMTIAVNTAYPQFRTGTFFETIKSILTLSTLPPEQLEIEITERVIMHESTQLDETVAQIRRLGVKLAIDDYGSGYSSITYLKRFPFTALKIDKSFVQAALERQEDATLVSTIAQLSSNLGLSTTAEGVETEEQLAYLAKEGCQQAQGYLISRPLPPAQFLALLESTETTTA